MKKLSYSLIMIILFSMSIGMINLEAEDLEEKKIEQMLPKYLSSNNAGKKFFITFHPCWEEMGPNNAMKVYISSERATTVKATIPAFGWSETKTTIPNGIIEFSFDPSRGAMYRKTDREKPEPEKIWKQRAIIIEANDPIICYGVTRYRYTSDGYLALPVSGLGKRYQASAFADPGQDNGTQYLGSYISIVAAYDGTDVIVTIGGSSGTWVPSEQPGSYEVWEEETGFLIGDKLTRRMNEGDVWLIPSRGHNSDLSGTIITANKPVAVIDGSYCAYIPVGTAACDYIISQELPTNTWGNKYHISPIIKRKLTSWVKIYAAENWTTFYKNGFLEGTLAEVGYKEDKGYISRRLLDDEVLNQAVTLSADKPFTITQYNPGQNDDNVPSDPFQMVLTPIEQYQNGVIFNTPGIRGGASFRENYMNLIFLAEPDGSTPDHLEFGVANPIKNEYTWTKVAHMFTDNAQIFTDPELYEQIGRNYAYYQIELDDPTAVYRIKSEEPIAAYGYGFDQWDSYGYPLSVALNDLSIPDTMAPRVDYTVDKFGNITGTITDEPEFDSERRSNLRYIELDSKSENFRWSKFEAPEFVAGEDYKVDFELNIVDPTKDAKAILYMVDRAGNSHVESIDFSTPNLSIVKQNEDWGLLLPGSESVSKTFTLINNKSNPIEFDEIEVELKSVFDDDEGDYLEHQGFTIVDLPEITSPITANAEFTFDVVFDPSEVGEGTFQDSIGVRLLRNGGVTYYNFLSRLRAQVGDAVISVTDQTFPDREIGTTSDARTITISNLGSIELEITGYTGPTLTRLDGDKVFNESGQNIIGLNSGINFVISADQSATFNVAFSPDEEKEYTDEIVFESNSNTSSPEHDPICVLNGKGVKSKIDVEDFTWVNFRTNLEKYDTYPYRDKKIYPAENEAIKITNNEDESITFASATIVNNIMGEAFKVDYDGFLRELADEDLFKNMFDGKSLASGGENSIPAYFDPETEGEHRLTIELETESGKMAVIDLRAIAIHPRISVNDLNFTPSGPYTDPDKHLVGEIIIDCDEWDYADAVEIRDIVSVEAGAISFDGSTFGSQGFMIDRSKLSFPIILQPGETLAIPVYFSSQFTGKYEAELEIISDAEGTTTAKLEGEFFTSVSIAEKDEEIELTPQPASEFVTVEYEKGITSYKILDISGKLALEMKDLPKSNSIRINLSKLSAGVYFIEVNQDPKLRRKMIIE